MCNFISFLNCISKTHLNINFSANQAKMDRFIVKNALFKKKIGLNHKSLIPVA